MTKEIKMDAFIIWLVYLGYQGVRKSDGNTFFYHSIVSKSFPRNVIISYDKKMNKVARSLFKEFNNYLEN